MNEHCTSPNESRTLMQFYNIKAIRSLDAKKIVFFSLTVKKGYTNMRVTPTSITKIIIN